MSYALPRLSLPFLGLSISLLSTHAAPSPVQGVASQGKGVRHPSTALHPTLCPVLELVTFHLISRFSPFSHCPLGVAEVGVSGVPPFLPALPLPGAPPIPVPCVSAHILNWPLPQTWRLSRWSCPSLPSPTWSVLRTGPGICALSHVSVPHGISVSTLLAQPVS